MSFALTLPRNQIMTQRGLTKDYQEISNGYIEDVLSGQIISGKWTRLACERQRKDLLRQGTENFPYVYDAAVGAKACRFCELMPHVEGKQFAGKKIVLQPWQVFVTLTVFSWLDIEGGSRFRRAYTSVAKGNGKSTWAAPLALFRAFADNEPGSQVFSCASSKEQAKITWSAARQMLMNSPQFTQRAGIEIEKHSLHQAKSNSFFRPLASDDRTSEGKNPTLVLFDELHTLQSREFYDSLDTATGKRQGALLFVITTRGTDLSSCCHELDTEVIKILSGVLHDETLFGIIYAPDEKDDWATPASWVKANPSIDVCVSAKTIRDKCAAAIQIPSQQSSFKTKHANTWVKSDSSWMDMTKFFLCADSALREEDYATDDCVIGLDLASKLDILAGMKVFYRTTENKRHYYVFGSYWLPSEQVNKKENGHYKGWSAQHIINECPGETNDYDAVEDWIREECKTYKVQSVSHDQYQAVEIVNHLLTEGVPMVEFTQRAVYFTPAMDELEAAVLDKRFHYNDPILAWSISNVVRHRDRNSMLFPIKEAPQNKIDAAVALLMAIGTVIKLAGNTKSSGGSVTLIESCSKCTALCIGENVDGSFIFVCEKCRKPAINSAA
jgi:phage terminase large subunit-like protein